MEKPSRKLDNGLYRNPNGRCWLYSFKWKGKSHYGNTGMEAKPAARKWLKEYREGLSNGTVGIVDPIMVPKLREAILEWCANHAQQVGDSHVSQMRSLLEHCKPWLDYRLHEIDNNLCMAIRARYLSHEGTCVWTRGGKTYVTTRKHTRGGANTVVKMLSSLLNCYVKGPGKESAPLKAMPFAALDKLPVQSKSLSVIWAEDVPKFLNAIDSPRQTKAGMPIYSHPHVQLAVRLCIGCGLRPDTEAMTLEWKRRKDESAGYVDMKSRKLHLEKTKDFDARTIDLPYWLWKYLLDFSTVAVDQRTGLLMPAVSRTGEEICHEHNYLSKAVRNAVEAAGLDSGVTPKRLRATFATCHWENATPIKDIALALGHASPETTLAHYIVVRTDKSFVERQDKVGEAMGFGKAQKIA